MKSNLLAQLGQGAMTDALRTEPSPADRTVARAHDAKVHATDAWVRGEMTSKEHAAVHKRADSVIKKKGRK